MDDEVVIELGSSDEEAEPPPKKRKPVPNAMVHIPTMLPGITIKPAITNKSIPATLQGIPIKQNAAKPVKQNAAQKSNMIFNPFVNKLKNNSVSVKRTGNTVIFKKEIGKPSQNKDQRSNTPINLNKSLIISQSKKAPNKQIVLKKSLPIKGPQVLNFLPSSITVTKAPISRPKNVPSMSGLQNRKNIIVSKPILKPKEVLTVNLDDDEAFESTPGAQWYLKPEEESNKDNEIEEQTDGNNDEKTETLEEENNKEPQVKKYVEITIEDSPMKPVDETVNQASDIGKELPIVIEDSPCKKKPDVEIKSDNKEKPVPKSRKKLLKLGFNNDDGIKQTVEIEFDPIKSTSSLNTDSNEESKSSGNEMCNKNSLQTKSESKKEEFHSIYQEFIDTCFKLENSEDMKKIVEKKIKTYYKQCPKEYVESEEFIDIVSSKIMAMKEGPDKLYLYIKDVVDELNLQRKMARSQETKKDIVPTVSEKKSDVYSEEEKEYSTKRSKQIRKLDKTIKKLHRAIQKLEEQEVDFDDEDDSVFLLTERYKERLVRVHAKYCQMTNTKMPSEPRVVLEVRPGRPQGPTKKLEKFINKKVPIGTPLPFPDFHDVVRCVQEANREDDLGWNDMDIKDEARDLFVRCGKKLQRRRQENEWRIAVSRVQTEKDPAEQNESLQRKLKENKVVAAKRENEVFNKFVDRQNQLKLEAEEIGDKEAEESPVESDDEEIAEMSDSLEDKQKRKERLKRLIQEKGKKVTNEKVTSVEEQDKNNDNVPENNDTNDKNIDGDKDSEEPESKSVNPDINKVNDESMEENNKDSEELESKSDNQVTIDADDLNNNDDKETESNIIEVDSDIDELHLLQKLRFEDEITSSSCYSSDSDSPIAISDSLDSDSDHQANKRRRSKECDVISIENSSYSESETNYRIPIIEEIDNDSIEVFVSNNKEVEFSTDKISVPGKANTEDLMENIRLASSENDIVLEHGENDTNLKDNETSKKDTVSKDNESCSLNDNATSEDATLQKDTVMEDGDTCINLNDNASSEEDANSQKDTGTEDGETCINLNDNVWSEEDATLQNDIVMEDGDPCVNLNDNASTEEDESSQKVTGMEDDDTCINLNDNVWSEEDATLQNDIVMEDGDPCVNLNDNALSEEDANSQKDTGIEDSDVCVNLNDNASSEEDANSQKDAIIEDGNTCISFKENASSEDGTSEETCINLRDDSISITEMAIEGEDIENDPDASILGEGSNDACSVLDKEVDMETLNTNDESPSDVLVEPKDDTNEPDICSCNNINHQSDCMYVKDNDNELEIIEKVVSVESNNEEEHKT